MALGVPILKHFRVLPYKFHLDLSWTRKLCKINFLLYLKIKSVYNHFIIHVVIEINIDRLFYAFPFDTYPGPPKNNKFSILGYCVFHGI